MRRVHGFIAVLSLATAPAALAGFRCDTDLVGRGMTPFEVVERCGEPFYELGFVDYRYPGLFVRVDEWAYEQGSNRFRRLLTFENGRLIRIETRAKPGGPQLEERVSPRPRARCGTTAATVRPRPTPDRARHC